MRVIINNETMELVTFL